MKSYLINKIKDKSIRIGIIGLGYVGLPLAKRFIEKKFEVVGFDVDKSKIKMLNSGESYINHISHDQISILVENGFIATDDFEIINSIDAIIICVPTPLGIHNEPDLSYLFSTMRSIKNFMKKNQIMILESTTYPGTTEEEIVPFVNKLDFKIGENYFIGYSPEREDPGNPNFSTKTIPKIVSGHSQLCLDITKSLYDQVVDVTVPVSSTKVAEMTKIMENIHRAVNIGLVNELKIVAEKMGINIYEVIEAASTKPFGFTPYFPGPGLGGHCIPIDPFYLTWKAKEIGLNTRFIELAGEINTSMPGYVIDRITEALNNSGKPVQGSDILVLGLSYKKNVDDLRESPSLEIINTLIKRGANISYCDPFFNSIPATRKYQFSLEGKKLSEDLLKKSDIVVLATDHDIYNYELILEKSKIIVDTRGKFPASSKIIRA